MVTNRSRDSAAGIATGYERKDRGGRISSPERIKNFLFSVASRPALGSTQPPIQWVQRALSSQADFSYSSVFLKLTACLLAVLLQFTSILRPLTTQLRNSADLYRRGTDTDLQKTHHVIAIQPVHWRSGWT
jgi:hypothetical protein